MDNTKEENDLIKRCSRCGNISLKSNFHKKLSSRNGLNTNCNVCRKLYLIKNFSRN